MKCLQKRERVWLIFTDPFRQRVIVGVIIDYRQWDDKHRPALVNTRDRSLLLTVSLTLSLSLQCSFFKRFYFNSVLDKRFQRESLKMYYFFFDPGKRCTEQIIATLFSSRVNCVVYFSPNRFF